MREIFFLIASCALVCSTTALLDAVEQHVLEECLERYGGLTFENAQRLERFAQWSNTYEEIPCFTQCYLEKRYNNTLYTIESGFNQRNVAKKFGQPLYNACKEQLQQTAGNTCQLAYIALHCLVSLENDPLIIIESMPNLSIEAKAAMKSCLVQVDQSKWPLIRDYGTYPVVEPIPCFTQCFIGKLQLYGERTRRWNVSKMRAALGLPAANANTHACSIRRGRNRCMTVYQQFTCFVLAK